MRSPSFLFLLLCLLTGIGCARHNNTPVSISSMQLPQGGPMLLAVYQPWFGKSSHINVGYSCHDPVVLRQQIARAKDLNIGGFAVNWYGPEKDFEDQALALLMQAAAENSFNIAVQYDEPVDHPGGTTEQVLSDFDYLYKKYISPEAGSSSAAYLRYHGRPVIFIFPKDGQTDWNRVRQATESWPQPPLLIYKDQNARYPNAFDGYYAWVQPGRGGWQHDGSNTGQDYLENFYRTMQRKYPDKLIVGTVWPGFDDSKASWRRGRRMDYKCGRTFEDGLRTFRHFYGNDNAPAFLLIATWNDYEEGTDIERGISHCDSGGGAVNTSRLRNPY